MIRNIGKRLLRTAFNYSLKGSIKYQKITTKFTYGQAGFCQLDLKNRDYIFNLTTIWEDYCEIEVEGLDKQSQQHFIAIQNQGKALLSDYKLANIINAARQPKIITISMKVPQDYTFQGILNGSMQQIKTPASNRLRSQSFILTLLGNNRFIKLNQVQTPRLQVKGQKESFKLQISKITVESGQVQCFNFVTDKLMISNSFKGFVKNHAFLKSLIMYGNARSFFDCGRTFEVDSISGMTSVKTKVVDAKRCYKSLSTKQESFSHIDTEEIRQCNIQSGNFDISYTKGNLIKPSIGKTFKGSIEETDSLDGKTLCKIRQ